MAKEKEVTVDNKLGLHARPAAMLVRKVMGYNSDVFLEKDGERVSAKSIMGIMGFAACKGTSLKVIAEGADEVEAVQAVVELFRDKFGEE